MFELSKSFRQIVREPKNLTFFSNIIKILSEKNKKNENMSEKDMTEATIRLCTKYHIYLQLGLIKQAIKD